MHDIDWHCKNSLSIMLCLVNSNFKYLHAHVLILVHVHVHVHNRGCTCVHVHSIYYKINAKMLSNKATVRTLYIYSLLY